ncbi:glycosyltransferase [Tsukamurella hominis]|uniref:glycosyltransferase n=1 Tax=Tsukamurella hominis TaxID=1970232 RepID=UPI0039EABB13
MTVRRSDGLSDPALRAAALHDAVDGLRERDPDASASVAFYPWQRNLLLGLVAVVLVAAVFDLVGTLRVLVAVATVAYVVTLVDRLLLFRRGLTNAGIRVSDERARAVPDADLPSYTVLVPAYDEPEVVGGLIAAMRSLDYPAEKLQVLLLLEADDQVTIDAAREVAEDDLVTVVLVPPADPRTKPKACNYGLHFADGEIITIYDAEDLPDPLQLRRTAVAFADLDDDVACVQSNLNFHNASDNVLAAWFTADYAVWFGYILPGLMASDSPIPLGGTSNHLRRSVLDEIGSWDPFNVTEDADLGVRIAARGYRTAVLDSVTYEEANIDGINWVRQRSRWYKGYLQTWLVHTRHPVRLVRELGAKGFLRFTTLLAGTPLIACMNMAFWLLMILWFFGQYSIIRELFGPLVYYPALASLVIGNLSTVYMTLVTIREDHRPDLFWPALLVPGYWAMMSVAAIKGTYQLIRNPSYWEKTFHGLSASKPPGGSS